VYQPNFQDPRVRARCLKALMYIDQYMKSGQRVQIAQSQFNKHFGQLNRPLAQWLKHSLLTCVNKQYVVGIAGQQAQCQKYQRNDEHILKLKRILGIDPAVKPEVAISPQEQQELDTGLFDYKEKGDRSYHRLQNLPRQQRRTLLSRHSFRHEYDIESCALTLLLQHSRHRGLPAAATPLLNEIINNRQRVREQLSQELELPVSDVKNIMAKVLNGGRISAWYGNHIFAQVNHNALMIRALNQNPTMTQYKQEVRLIWRSIRTSMNLPKGQRLASRDKSRVYLELERLVTDSVRKYLKKHKIKSFWIHDGWSCDQAIDRDDLAAHVRRTTGYHVRFDWCQYD